MTKLHMTNPRARAEVRQRQAAYERELELERRRVEKARQIFTRPFSIIAPRVDDPQRSR